MHIIKNPIQDKLVLQENFVLNIEHVLDGMDEVYYICRPLITYPDGRALHRYKCTPLHFGQLYL